MGNGNVIVNKSYIMQIKLAATTNSTVARLSKLSILFDGQGEG
jgi:hypothetical protein